MIRQLMRFVAAPAMIFCLAMPNTLWAVDTVTQVVSGLNASGGKAIGAFGYDPTTDTMYVTSYGFTGSGINAAIRKIDNVSDLGTQTSTPYVSESQMRLFFVDGNPDRSATGPTQGGILLNPMPIGDKPAYSFALLADASFTRYPASTTVDPNATKRIYEYDLNPLMAYDSGSGTYLPTGDPLTGFTARVNLADMNTAAGASASNTSSNTGRQFTWSGDGQSIYFNDSSSTLGGIWKYEVASGNVSQLLASGNTTNTEPAVVHNSVTGADTIYFEGAAGAYSPSAGTVVDNKGGIDYIVHNGTTTTDRTVRLEAQAVRDFFETPDADANIYSITSDADGNLYFGNTTSGQRGIYRLDTEGRLAKVMSASERAAVAPGSNSQTLRMQARTVEYDGDGPGGNDPFTVTQILFADSNSDGVLGANAFLPGDFNRDNELSSLDIDLFKPEIDLRGVLKTDVEDMRFDMNGNDVVDWKDVKILQTFMDFGDGDADLNGIVDFADFQILQNNFGLSNKTFLSGDFNGDDIVNFADFQLLQNSYGYQSSILLGATAVPFDAVAWNSFLATVPEPSSITLAATAIAGVLAASRLRKRRRS